MAAVHRDERDAIWVLTIDNEEKRNAFSGDMVGSLLDHLNAADASPKVRCVIITGAGQVSFSSGHDLTEILDHGERAFSAEENAGFVRPASLRKPVIAAINGYAYAAGFILALSCDLRVAAANASFCAPGARIGLLPVGGQLSRLPSLISYGKALEMLYTAQPVSAQEAFEAGFVNRLVPEGEALPAALDLAKKIAANSPAVVQAVKRGADFSFRNGADAGDVFEWTTGALLSRAPDAAEGVNAFLEKRAPNFADV